MRKTPSSAAEPCYCGLARRASRTLTEIYERELEPHGITLPQFSLLRAVQAQGPVGITELAAAQGLDRTTLGRNLKLLEKAGLAEFIGNESDQRERLVVLTAGGEKTAQRALTAWQAAQARIRRGLGREKLDALRDIAAQIDALAA